MKDTDQQLSHEDKLSKYIEKAKMIDIETHLIYAIDENNIFLVKQILDKHPYILTTEPISLRYSVFQYAFDKGNIKILEIMLEKDPARLDLKDSEGNSYLVRAIINSNEKIWQWVIDNIEYQESSIQDDDSIESTDTIPESEKNLMLYKAKLGETEDIKLLSEINPNLLNVADKYGNNLVMIAAKNLYHDMLKFLLFSGVEIKNNDSGYSPLHAAINHEITSGYNFDTVKLLLEFGANPNVAFSNEESSNITPLHCATRLEQIEVSCLLVGYGANLRSMVVNNIDGSQTISASSLFESMAGVTFNGLAIEPSSQENQIIKIYNNKKETTYQEKTSIYQEIFDIIIAWIYDLPKELQKQYLESNIVESLKDAAITFSGKKNFYLPIANINNEEELEKAIDYSKEHAPLNSSIFYSHESIALSGDELSW